MFLLKERRKDEMGWRWFWRGRTKWMRLESREGFGGCFMEREREKERERESGREGCRRGLFPNACTGEGIGGGVGVKANAVVRRYVSRTVEVPH